MLVLGLSALTQARSLRRLRCLSGTGAVAALRSEVSLVSCSLDMDLLVDYGPSSALMEGEEKNIN